MTSDIDANARLLESLLKLPRETEWVEFKHNNSNPEEIGEYISALANSAALLKRDSAFLVWGVENYTHGVIGTSFKPREQRVGNEELENWLVRLLVPRVEFRITEFSYQEHLIVIFEISACQHTPVRFRDSEFIRVGAGANDTPRCGLGVLERHKSRGAAIREATWRI